VPFDGARADEQLGADLRVRVAVTGESADLGLLCGEFVERLDCAFARGFAGGQELARGALGERVHAHRGEQPVGGAQLLARVEALAFAAQPFAVEEVGAGECNADAGAAEPVDRLAVEALGGLAVAQQRS
jgi:hypothetical protein